MGTPADINAHSYLRGGVMDRVKLKEGAHFLDIDPSALEKARKERCVVKCRSEISKNSCIFSIHWEAIQEQPTPDNYLCGQLEIHLCILILGRRKRSRCYK